MGRRIVPLVCVLVLFSLPLMGASQWVEIRSQHFSVLTDAGEKQGHQVALRFEQMRAIFGTIFDRSSLNAPAPLEIVAFQSQDEFMRYVPHHNGAPVNLDAFLQMSDDGNFIGIDLSSSAPYGTVFRDYSHLLLRNNFPVMPEWFEDGFARYFGAIKITGQQVESGDMVPQYVTLLNQTQWKPIATVMGVRRDSDALKDGAARALFEAESWLAVDYLLSNNRLADAFKYLQLAQIQHVAVADAMQQAFGVDAATFEKNLHGFLAASKGGSTSGLPELHDDPYSTNKRSDLEAQAVLADMHVHSDEYRQMALGQLQAILKADPENRIANRALGYWYLRSDQPAQAKPSLQKAVALNDGDPESHYLLAAAIIRQEQLEGRTVQQRYAAGEQLQRAIQIDAALAAPKDLLAFALADGGKFPDAIELEKKAIALEPGAEHYQTALARIYIQAEEWQLAQAVLQRLQTSEDPKIRDKATETLASLEATRQQAAEKRKEHEMALRDPTAPQWKMTPEVAKEDEQAGTEPIDKTDTRKTLYLAGELESVDCSRQPAALLTLRKGAKVLRLHTDDYTKLLLMGADDFSCGWRDKKVLVNYKPGGHADGDLVSLEVQSQ